MSIRASQLVRPPRRPALAGGLGPISARYDRKGTATLIRERDGELVYDRELQLRNTDAQRLVHGPRGRFRWHRIELLLGDEEQRAVAATRKRRSDRTRGGGRLDDRAARDLAVVEGLRAERGAQLAGLGSAALGLWPLGQAWLHFAPLRTGHQKGPDHLERWWEKRGIRLGDAVDQMRYLEGCFPDGETRFGAPFPHEPFQSSTRVAVVAFPTMLWPSDFAPWSGQPRRPATRAEAESHLTVGLLPGSYLDCLHRVWCSSELRGAADRIRSGEWVPASKQNRCHDDGGQAIEAEWLEPGFLEEYAWFAAAYALAGPPSPEYFDERGLKRPESAALGSPVSAFAVRTLYTLVDTHDRQLGRNQATAPVAERAGDPLARELLADEWSGWKTLRGLLDAEDAVERVRPTAGELLELLQSARRVEELSWVRSVYARMVRLFQRGGRDEVAAALVEMLEPLAADESLRGEVERVRLPYLWRRHTPACSYGT